MAAADDRRQFARSKWKVLANAVKKAENEDTHDLLRFPQFDAIHTEPIAAMVGEEKAQSWLRVKLQAHAATSPAISLNICMPVQDRPHLTDLTGFNNTGNVCVWPSEECLAQLCVENPSLFQKKRVIELGGGMTSIAGLAVAAACQPSAVLLTDGNHRSASNLESVVAANLSKLKNVSCQQLVWSRVPDSLRAQFDVAICSDCLFFDSARPELLSCIKSLLRPDGLAIVMAPSRHGTLEHFHALLESDPEVEPSGVLEHYSDKISQVRARLKKSESMFDDNLHYPKLIMVRMKSAG